MRHFYAHRAGYLTEAKGLHRAPLAMTFARLRTSSMSVSDAIFVVICVPSAGYEPTDATVNVSPWFPTYCVMPQPGTYETL